MDYMNLGGINNEVLEQHVCRYCEVFVTRVCALIIVLKIYDFIIFRGLCTPRL